MSSNAQLAPFAIPGLDLSAQTNGVSNGNDDESNTTAENTDHSYDPDCAEAIRENETVILRMRERLELLKEEVLNRGAVWPWGELDDLAAGKEPGEGGDDCGQRMTVGANWVNGVNGGMNGSGAEHGVEETEAEVNGVEDSRQRPDGGEQRRSGRLTDEDLRRRMEEQMYGLAEDGNDDNGGGMHL